MTEDPRSSQADLQAMEERLQASMQEGVETALSEVLGAFRQEILAEIAEQGSQRHAAPAPAGASMMHLHFRRSNVLQEARMS